MIKIIIIFSTALTIIGCDTRMSKDDMHIEFNRAVINAYKYAYDGNGDSMWWYKGRVRAIYELMYDEKK